MEAEQKEQLKKTYPEVAGGRADLYVYFYARALQLLSGGGTLAFISSNKFFRARYGKGLRDLLAQQTQVRLILDFGDAPVFDAAAYPCIVLTTTGRPAPDHTYLGLTANNQIDLEKIDATFAETAQTLSQTKGIQPPGSSSETSTLVQKLMQMGVPLGRYINGKVYRGVVSGLNDAFVINQATHDQLIAEDPHSSEVLKPFLRGRDVGRYAIHSTGLWLIYTSHGIDIQRYPAIEAYLKPYKVRLEQRATKQAWYELQQPQFAYKRAFEQSKILYPDIASRTEFSWDESGFYVGNTNYFLPTEKRYLCALLNSTLITYLYASLSPQIRGGFYRFFTQYVEQLPIIAPSQENIARLAALVDKLQALGGQGPDAEQLEHEVDAIVYRTYDLTEEEIAEIERWHAERRAQLGAGRRQ
jgi:adenine-specific DNA-methyltransferase